jgi:hypothetical protein
MDREQMQRCLDVVAVYRASGQKGRVWAQANGVSERSLASWCAHARRWQARLDGVAHTPKSPPRGFVATHLAPDAAPSTGSHADELRRHAARAALAAGPHR